MKKFYLVLLTLFSVIGVAHASDWYLDGGTRGWNNYQDENKFKCESGDHFALAIKNFGNNGSAGFGIKENTNGTFYGKDNSNIYAETKYYPKNNNGNIYFNTADARDLIFVWNSNDKTLAYTTVPNDVYLITNNGSWLTADNSKKGSKDGLKYTWQNVEITKDNNNVGYFQFASVLDGSNGAWNTINNGTRFGATSTPANDITGTVNVRPFIKNIDASSCSAYRVAPGTYNITLDLSTMTVKVESTKKEYPQYLWIRGSHFNNSWGATDAQKLTHQGNGVYTCTTISSISGTFKIGSDEASDWVFSHGKNDTNDKVKANEAYTTYVRNGQGNDIEVEGTISGITKVTFSLNADQTIGTLTFATTSTPAGPGKAPERLYLIQRENGNWDTTKGAEANGDGDKVTFKNVDLVKGEYFCFGTQLATSMDTDDAKWNLGTRYGYNGTQNVDQTGVAYKFKECNDAFKTGSLASGTYNVTLDFAKMTMTIVDASFEYGEVADVWFRGNFNSVSNWGSSDNDNNDNVYIKFSKSTQSGEENVYYGEISAYQASKDLYFWFGYKEDSKNVNCMAWTSNDQVVYLGADQWHGGPTSSSKRAFKLPAQNKKVYAKIVLDPSYTTASGDPNPYFTLSAVPYTKVETTVDVRFVGKKYAIANENSGYEGEGLDDSKTAFTHHNSYTVKYTDAGGIEHEETINDVYVYTINAQTTHNYFVKIKAGNHYYGPQREFLTLLPGEIVERNQEVAAYNGNNYIEDYSYYITRGQYTLVVKLDDYGNVDQLFVMGEATWPEHVFMFGDFHKKKADGSYEEHPVWGSDGGKMANLLCPDNGIEFVSTVTEMFENGQLSNEDESLKDKFAGYYIARAVKFAEHRYSWWYNDDTKEEDGTSTTHEGLQNCAMFGLAEAMVGTGPCDAQNWADHTCNSWDNKLHGDRFKKLGVRLGASKAKYGTEERINNSVKITPFEWNKVGWDDAMNDFGIWNKMANMQHGAVTALTYVVPLSSASGTMRQAGQYPEGVYDVVLDLKNNRVAIANGAIETSVNGIDAPWGEGIVNVYTMQGTLVRAKVMEKDAVKGLPAGIYIVGKKKVMVTE